MYSHANVIDAHGNPYTYCPSSGRCKKFLEDHQYDACLTDLNLPDGNGLQLLDWINQHSPHLPVAVLTAYGNMDIAIAALKAGAFDFVSKPINQKHLEQLLQKH